jgi:Papain fold toxin 2
VGEDLVNSQELRSQLERIARCFPLFECVPCARAIQDFLIEQGIKGRRISLYTGSVEEPFCNIYHDLLGRNISTNGRHVAIAVDLNGQEWIFDNIHPAGLPRVNWINNLYSPVQDMGGDFQVSETSF